MNINRQIFNDWLYSKGLSVKTVKNYSFFFDRFYYDRFDQKTVRLFMSSPGNNNSNARGFLINFKKFLIENFREFNINESDRIKIMEVELPKVTGRQKQKVINPLDYEQINMIEKYLKTEREKLMLLTTYYTGIRLDELFKIRELDINWDKWAKDTESMGEIKVHGKGNKERIIYVPSFVMVRIARFQRSKKGEINAFVFKTDKKSSIESQERTWQKHLNVAGEEAGLVKKYDNGKVIRETSVHPHRLRHSFATYCLDNGIDINEVKDLLGHSSISSTQIYLHVNRDKLKEKVGKIF